MENPEFIGLLRRITEALERLAPPVPDPALHPRTAGFLWKPQPPRLVPVETIAGVALSDLKNVERQRDALLANTHSFARGRPANNALLWGARGTGKSSLVKAVHAEVSAAIAGPAMALVQVEREDLATLPALLAILRDAAPRRFILFCDDLSFDGTEVGYKSLKSVLDGGIAGRPENVLFYVTSNRRHLLAREMTENERATAINPGEAAEEKISLADRFGLSLGFYAIDQESYCEMVLNYAGQAGIALSAEDLRRSALEWSQQRGSRSGRAAWQFVQHLAGQAAEAVDA